MNPYFQNIEFSLYELDRYSQRKECLKYSNDNYDSFINPDGIKKSNFFNQNYLEIDKVFQDLLYTENGITIKTSNLPFFPKDQYNHDISLFSQNYFGLDIQCIKEIRKDGLSDEILKDLKTISNISSISLFSLKLILFIFAFFVLIIFLTSDTGKFKQLYPAVTLLFLINSLSGLKQNVGIGENFKNIFGSPR